MTDLTEDRTTVVDDEANPAGSFTPSSAPFLSGELGDALIAAGLFDRDEIERHAHEAQRLDTALGAYLTLKHLISRADLYEVLGRQKKPVKIASVRDLPDWDIVLNDLAQPLASNGPPKDVLVLGTRDDLASNRRRGFILATQSALGSHRYATLFAKMMTEGYANRATLVLVDASTIEVVLSEWKTRTTSGSDKGDRSSSEVQGLWDTIIQDALNLGASDVHLEATLGKTEVSFRIHGELEQQVMSLTEDDGMNLASAMYNTMVDEGSTKEGFNPRITQDAVVTRQFPVGAVRLRFNCMPIEPSGISVTLRLIPVGLSIKPKTAAQLGYAPDQCEALSRIFSRSSGMILFVGTTGSGKSTSMANMAMQLVKDRPGKKLRTVEEPVEIRIPGASQTSVARSKKDDGANGDEFIDVMRSLLRADPDYLMVGEIRDYETAALAMQAVRSGHLCISTLHADGAPIVYDRLSGMGIPRGDIASVGLIAGLVYQRLVAVLCPSCRVSASEIAKEDKAEHSGVIRRLKEYLNGDSLDGIFFKSDVGCRKCGHRGIIGRTVCAEILVPKPNMLQAIADGDSNALWRMWREEIDTDHPESMRGRTAFEHARWKMRGGVCSPVDVEKEFRFLDEEVY